MRTKKRLTCSRAHVRTHLWVVDGCQRWMGGMLIEGGLKRLVHEVKVGHILRLEVAVESREQ